MCVVNVIVLVRNDCDCACDCPSAGNCAHGWAYDSARALDYA